MVFRKFEKQMLMHFNQQGQALVEYAVILVVVIVIAMVAMRALGFNLRDYINDASSAVFG